MSCTTELINWLVKDKPVYVCSMNKNSKHASCDSIYRCKYTTKFVRIVITLCNIRKKKANNGHTTAYPEVSGLSP
jgi:hypothetical protein